MDALRAGLGDTLAALTAHPAMLLAIIGAVFIAAVVRGFTGFGFMLAAVPLMGLLMAPSRAVPVAVGLQFLAGLMDFRRASADCHWPSLRWMMLGAVIGSPLGAIVLSVASAPLARVIIACVALGAVAVLGKGFVLAALPGRLSTMGFGFVAGISNGLAGMPGPPAVAYYMAVPLGRVVARASLLVFFFATSIAALTSVLWLDLADRDTIVISAIALPFLWIGSWAGGRLFELGSERLHRRASVTIMAVIALSSGIKGMSELL